ncbi:DUF5054 domain-containing protein [Agromyces sp. NPDC127015]|uniref:DUF5054 domain-containing protein n=1 Tax=Agromyces sp. NPDC127015 TaxID=3347108 RepID=UPI003660B264
MISTIHVVFKTHLDIGFTALASDIVDRYLHSYLPRAIDLSEELERRGGPARFTWTTGSWLIHEALRSSAPAERARLEEAIRKRRIHWHGLPLTTHTEVMDRALVDYGISIAKRLDERFERRTLAAKMTDVPGHTVGLVPALAAAGLDYLHLGVNGASAVPEVPEFFRWVAPDGSEVVVNYAGSYGATDLGLAVVPGGTDALHLAFTGDNFGPPSADEVEVLFAQLAEAHPDARIVASGLDDFARAVLAVRDELPVVDDEIGDTWIHGVGADPLLTAGLRGLLGLRAEWIANGDLVEGDDECDRFSEALLLIAEHTWGEDLKTFLPDYANYTKDDFAAARSRDEIDLAANPPEAARFEWAAEHAGAQGLRYSGFEASWAEQRGYLDRAVDALAPERGAAARAAIAGLTPTSAGETRGTSSSDARRTPVERGDDLALGGFTVRFGDDGSIVSLVDEAGRQWAGPEHRLGAYRHQTFDERDEARWVDEYCRDLDETGFWAIPDQSKPGLSIAERQPAQVSAPVVESAGRITEADADRIEFELVMPERAAALWGAPRRLRLRYRFPHADAPIGIELDVLDREASRLPEASWFGFRPRVDGDWRLDKLGVPVDPRRVVSRGNRSLHAVSAVECRGSQHFRLRTIDAPLVAVGEPRLLRFDDLVAEPADGLHVNLHNNVWGTNFRMWFDDDLSYRFELELGR